MRTFLALTLLELGETAEARRVLERGGEPPDFAADGARYWLVTRLALELAEGRAEDAVATAERIARDYPGRAERRSSTRGAAYAAEAHDRLGDRERGARAGRARRSSSRAAGARRASSAARCACSGRSSATTGLDHLREAVELLAASPARLEHAKALAALGSALRRSRKPTEAREPLRRALELRRRLRRRRRSPRTSAPSSTPRARGRARRPRAASAR